MQLTKYSFIGTVLITTLLAYSPRASAQTTPPDVKAFVQQYVAAVNAKDPTRLRALYDPKALSCITPENKSFYDDVMSHHLDDPIPPNYTFKISPVNENNLKAIESMGGRPAVHPAQELQIDYQIGDDGGSIVIYLIRENGRLFDDEPCATDEYIRKYREEAPANAKRLAEYKAIADAIKEPLRAQLVALLDQHKTAAAVDRYKAASGKDTTTSMFVMHVLATQARATTHR